MNKVMRRMFCFLVAANIFFGGVSKAVFNEEEFNALADKQDYQRLWDRLQHEVAAKDLLNVMRCKDWVRWRAENKSDVPCIMFCAFQCRKDWLATGNRDLLVG